jgi:hypothetical protein
VPYGPSVVADRLGLVLFVDSGRAKGTPQPWAWCVKDLSARFADVLPIRTVDPSRWNAVLRFRGLTPEQVPAGVNGWPYRALEPRMQAAPVRPPRSAPAIPDGAAPHAAVLLATQGRCSLARSRSCV